MFSIPNRERWVQAVQFKEKSINCLVTQLSMHRMGNAKILFSCIQICIVNLEVVGFFDLGLMQV